jgi:hypothetical protein
MDLSKLATTQPIGLATIALSIGVTVGVKLHGWLRAVVMVATGIALFGGLYLGYRQIVAQEEAESIKAMTHHQGNETKSNLLVKGSPNTSIVHQETHGAGSPTIQGGGNVTITVNQNGRGQK